MRDYKKEYREYHARPEQKKNRAARNLWNRRLKGRVPAGKEIDHRQPLAAGGGNTRANIRFRSVSTNRGDKSHVKSASAIFGEYLEKRASARGEREVDKLTPRELALVSAVGIPAGYVTTGYARRYLEELSKRPALSHAGGIGAGIIAGSLAARGALYTKRALGLPDPERDRLIARHRR